MSDDMKTLGQGFVQFLIAALVGAGLIPLYLFSMSHPIAIENWIEVVQSTCALLSGFLFWRSAARQREWRGGLLLITGFFIAIFIRESDAYFDKLHHGAWKYVLIVYLLGLLLAIKRAGFSTVIPGLAAFVRSRSFLMMLPGTAIVLVYSRLYGYKGLWLTLMGDYEKWQVMKGFAEESTELLGYILMLGAAIFWLVGRRNVYLEHHY